MYLVNKGSELHSGVLSQDSVKLSHAQSKLYFISAKEGERFQLTQMIPNRRAASQHVQGFLAIINWVLSVNGSLICSEYFVFQIVTFASSCTYYIHIMCGKKM